ncbi:AAA family ATPase, partial [Vibrio parahaemolyticus]
MVKSMIESIDFKLIGTSDKRVITNLNGKNLIITGENGCGKTRFLRQLHQYLQQFFKRQIQSKESIQQQLNYHQTQL